MMQSSTLKMAMVFFLYACSAFAGYGQNYNELPQYLSANSVWAFGYKAGLDFNSGTATAIQTQMVGQTFVCEGSAAVADPNTGTLLFYTNGFTVWNSNHQPMPNGDSLFGNFSSVSTRQGAVIVPFIDNPNRYYVFSLKSTSLGNNPWFVRGLDTVKASLFYSVVDMTLEGGLGDIVTGLKNIPIDDSPLSEAMIAIPGCEKIWLLVHSSVHNFDNHNRIDFTSRNLPIYKAYEITANGVNPTPVVSPGKIDALHAFMSVSPNRKMIALGSGFMFPFSGNVNFGMEVSMFDVNTGTITDNIGIATSNGAGGNAFSPDSRFLYFDELSVVDSSSIAQCNVTVFDSLNIANSKVDINRHINTFGNGFRMYNDTIYIGATNATGDPSLPIHISTINNPNSAGLSCDFQQDAVQLLPGTYSQTSSIGNEVVFSISPDSVFVTIDTQICRQDFVAGINLSPTKLLNNYAYTWNNGSSDTSMSINGAGIYWVSYSDGCNFYSDTFIFEEIDFPQPEITIDSFVLRTALSYQSYQWLLNGGLINGATQDSYVVEENGDYQVIVSSDEGCIDTSNVYEVSNHPGTNIVNQAISPKQIKIYPNPTVHSSIQIDAPAPIQLSITDITGKVVLLPTTLTSGNSLVQLTGLTSGIFLLRFSDTMGRLLSVKKMIKVKE